ncbi:hypothetical protein M5K25_015200 [Dendrobium thyrsiflorum]|uniref:Uncharacterized protein n=1 Tax=Dendrobium thyrsiflorum TaxID=117978 RepID=A0ABD0UWY0_DENTH
MPPLEYSLGRSRVEGMGRGVRRSGMNKGLKGKSNGILLTCAGICKEGSMVERLSGPRCPRPSMKPAIQSSRYAVDPAARRNSTAAMVTAAALLANGKEDR